MDQVCTGTTTINNEDVVATTTTTTNIMTDIFGDTPVTQQSPSRSEFLLDPVIIAMNDYGHDMTSLLDNNIKNNDDDYNTDEWWNPDLFQNPQSVFGKCCMVGENKMTTSRNVVTSSCLSDKLSSSAINHPKNVLILRRTIPKIIKRIQDCAIINLDMDDGIQQQEQQGEKGSCMTGSDEDFTQQQQLLRQEATKDNENFKTSKNSISHTPTTCFTSYQSHSQDEVLLISSAIDTTWPFNMDVVLDDGNSPCKWYKRKRQQWKQTIPHSSAKIATMDFDTTTASITTRSTNSFFNIIPTSGLDSNQCNINQHDKFEEDEEQQQRIKYGNIIDENCSIVGTEWTLLSLPQTNSTTTDSPIISSSSSSSFWNRIIATTTPIVNVQKNKFKYNKIQRQHMMTKKSSPISNRIHNSKDNPTSPIIIRNDNDNNNKSLDNVNLLDDGNNNNGLCLTDNTTMHVVDIDHCKIPDSRDPTDDIDMTDDSYDEITVYDDNNNNDDNNDSYITNHSNICHIIQQNGTINEQDLFERKKRKQFNRLMYEQIRGITVSSKTIL